MYLAETKTDRSGALLYKHRIKEFVKKKSDLYQYHKLGFGIPPQNSSEIM